jgi:hypothetical protein
MQALNLTVAIDDVHPEKGWGLPEDECMEFLAELNKEFGTKFTLFIPSNYHKQYPISQYKDWISWLVSLGYFELAAHGHYHQTSDPGKWGECEFAEIASAEECLERVNSIWWEWNQTKHEPKGWRNPGWLAQKHCVDVIGKWFGYAAVHYEHNHNFQWPCKMIFGHDGIHETDIKLHNGNTLMFQSHIAGDWNKNVWNEENYKQFKMSLEFLKKNYILDNKFLREI